MITHPSVTQVPSQVQMRHPGCHLRCRWDTLGAISGTDETPWVPTQIQMKHPGYHLRCRSTGLLSHIGWHLTTLHQCTYGSLSGTWKVILFNNSNGAPVLFSGLRKFDSASACTYLAVKKLFVFCALNHKAPSDLNRFNQNRQKS